MSGGKSFPKWGKFFPDRKTSRCWATSNFRIRQERCPVRADPETAGIFRSHVHSPAEASRSSVSQGCAHRAPIRLCAGLGHSQQEGGLSMNWQEGVAVAVVLLGLGAGVFLVAQRPSFWLKFGGRIGQALLSLERTAAGGMLPSISAGNFIRFVTAEPARAVRILKLCSHMSRPASDQGASNECPMGWLAMRWQLELPISLLSRRCRSDHFESREGQRRVRGVLHAPVPCSHCRPQFGTAH